MTNPQKNVEIKRIAIVVLGESLKAEGQGLLIEQLSAVRYRDAYLLNRPEGEAWLFDYGILVCWDLPENDRQQLCLELAAVIDAPESRVLIEQYSYQYDSNNPFNILHDMLRIPEDDQMIRLGLSHAFAQSAKLEVFESKAQKLIQENAHISKELAATGKVSLSRRQVSKLRGVLFDTSSDITLHYNLLDTPEFFWDYPELESVYEKLAKYLDLLPRVHIMNKKLETIQSMLDMLAAEQYHKHSAFLEWVIIILIAVDIVIYFVH